MSENLTTALRSHTLIRDMASLKVFYNKANEEIWYVQGDGPPTCAATSLNDFLRCKPLAKAQNVRIIGSPENAKLILLLYHQRDIGAIGELEICSPMVCSNNIERQNPKMVLLNMRRWAWSASIGGWHTVDQNDYHAFLLSHELQNSNYMVDDNIRRIVKQHAAWPSLSFISHIDPSYAAVLLGILLDPRWYIDLNDPNSSAKLKAYLGLTPRTQGYVSGLAGYVHGIHPDRCNLVMKTWKTTEKPPKGLDQPGNFLWRVWLSQGEGVMSDLRASQAMISFLRHTWVHALYANKPGNYKLFVPEYFFKQPKDVEAYNQHVDQYRNKNHD